MSTYRVLGRRRQTVYSTPVVTAPHAEQQNGALDATDTLTAIAHEVPPVEFYCAGVTNFQTEIVDDRYLHPEDTVTIDMMVLWMLEAFSSLLQTTSESTWAELCSFDFDCGNVFWVGTTSVMRMLKGRSTPTVASSAVDESMGPIWSISGNVTEIWVMQNVFGCIECNPAARTYNFQPAVWNQHSAAEPPDTERVRQHLQRSYAAFTFWIQVNGDPVDPISPGARSVTMHQDVMASQGAAVAEHAEPYAGHEFSVAGQANSGDSHETNPATAYRCRTCVEPRYFKRACNRNKHERENHGEPAHACSETTCLVKTKQDLKVNGTRCDCPGCRDNVCRRRFAQKSDLARHVQTVHCRLKTIKCKLAGCDARFGRYEDRIQHLRKDH
ncbi:hypothetical protein BGZ83_004975 [Gryganskiella cystojenkinii]|nr:hypothetical protein BGZ83_004975 [Gryganskiella cystojenkinii]